MKKKKRRKEETDNNDNKQKDIKCFAFVDFKMRFIRRAHCEIAWDLSINFCG